MKTERFFINLVGKIVSIDWRDSNMYITQCNLKDDLDISIITSIGKVIACDATKLVIAGDIVGDEINGEIRRVIAIPIENIIGLSNDYTPPLPKSD